MMYLKTDSAIGRSLDVYGEWCEHELQVLGRLISTGDWVLDVGANIGTHTVFFARAVGRKGRVVAIEPQSTVQHVLHANIALNDFENVRVVAAACGAERGKVRAPVFALGDKRNVGGYSLSAVGSSTESVDVVTVDSLKLKRCHLIKIDVEGAEQDVLQGAHATIARLRPLLWVENNDEAQSASLISRLRALGYALHWHFDTRFNPRNFRGAAENIFAKARRPSSNLLCVPVEESDRWREVTDTLLDVAESETTIAAEWARWQQEHSVHV